jgi:hypothetical protein
MYSIQGTHLYGHDDPLDAHEKDRIEESEVAAVKKLLQTGTPEFRCNYSYLVGELLASKQQVEAAEPF